MKVLDNESVIFFDVDDTLVLWGMESDPRAITVRCAYTHKDLLLVPHEKHIELVKTHKARGYLVVVWSAGGFAHAENVVKALKLEQYVDIVMSKPVKYVDDLEAVDILGNRIYMRFK